MSPGTLRTLLIAGRYEVLSALGRGATGGVYHVRDLVTGGELALKTLRASADDLLRASFEREFVSLAQLSIDGVARVVDFGLATDEQGTPAPFFTREYVPGASLSAHEANAALSGNRGRRRSFPELLVLMRDLSLVVSRVHRAGLVHGDLKPGNVIVDAHDKPWLIDFGLARFEHQAAVAERSGTLGYMAPELLSGGTATAATDVYALGATLFQLLTGAPPSREEAHQLDRGRLSAEDYRSRFGDLDGAELEQVSSAFALAIAAMTSDARLRMPSAAEFAAGLEKIVGASPDSAVDPFVVPPPRGQQDGLGKLNELVASALDGGIGAGASLVGPRGAGRTTMLCALRWRLGLRGVTVLELRGDESASHAAELLTRQLQLPDPDRAGRAQNRERLLQANASFVLFVDDVDRAEPPLLALLAELVIDSKVRGRALVTSSVVPVDALAELKVVEIAPLSDADARAFIHDATGGLDPAVVRLLIDGAQGRPGRLVYALRRLGRAPTQQDVLDLALETFDVAAQESSRLLAGLGPREVECATFLSIVVGGVKVTAIERQWPRALRKLVRLGLVSSEGDWVRSNFVSEVVPPAMQPLCRVFLNRPDELSILAGLYLHLAIGDLNEASFVAASELVAHGEARRVLGWYGAVVARSTHLIMRERARVCIAELSLLAGLNVEAVSAATLALHANALAASERLRASKVLARGLVGLSQYADARKAIAEAQAPEVFVAECAKIELREGAYDRVLELSEPGATEVQRSPSELVEMLTCRGMALSYRGHALQAEACYRQALTVALESGQKRDEALVQAYIAIGLHRAGNFVAAKEHYQRNYELVSQMSDVGAMATAALNLGTVNQELADFRAALESYDAAARYARRSGKASTAMLAQNNLANLLLFLGAAERADLCARDALARAQASGSRLAEAQATALLGEVSALHEHYDESLAHYRESIRIYGELGQQREIAEVGLDTARSLLDRQPPDASAAAAFLASARVAIDSASAADLEPKLRLLSLHARFVTLGGEGLVAELEGLLLEARASRDRELRWRLPALLALVHEAAGSMLLSERYAREAVEWLESVAGQLPREFRETFWHPPVRRELRRRARTTSQLTADTTQLRQVRLTRVLELVKRLASERDVDRLLERIVDAAIELSGAERGFVLLVGADGKLAPRVSREANPSDDPHHLFSQSIAESVLIDREAIVTTDASSDRRVRDFMSVHRLMLRSVACLPIRTPERVVGVLYLEHRTHTGRFVDSDVELLSAFADQAAIALENARLLQENVERQAALTTALAELERAHREIERLYDAKTVELESTKQQLRVARIELGQHFELAGMVGRSDAMRRVFATIERVAGATVPVVIEGESGTGKELVARAIHSCGPRATENFVAINCGGMSESLLESELFGVRRGAFTGADRDREGLFVQAHGGTVFLDEIADMPAKMQVDLLRVLQDGRVRPLGANEEIPVNVRVIAASNRPLRSLVDKGRFREDLYYRLAVVSIGLPPLRERREDIPLLCAHFLRKCQERFQSGPKKLSPRALEIISASPMEGNVRQLEHLLVQAWVMTDGDVIGEAALAGLASQTGGVVPHVSGQSSPPEPGAIRTVLDHKEAERAQILAALAKVSWNRARAASELGIPRRTFYRRLREYGILGGED